MSSAYLKSKIEERTGLAEAMTGVLDRCAEKATEPNAEERAQLEKWGSQVKVLDAEIAELETRFNADKRFEQVLNRMSDGEERAERRQAADPPAPTPQGLGELIAHDPIFTEYRGRGTSARVEVPDIFGLEGPSMEERAAITTATGLADKSRWGGTPGPAITTPLLSAINHERVSTGSFDYVKWGKATGVAKVAEAAQKPEVALAPALATLSLDTYAGWVAITRQALEDIPRVQSQIETRLRQNLAAVLEAAAAAVIEAATPAQAGGESLAGIREAIGTLQGLGYTPTGIMLNPADFAAIDVATMHETNYGPVPTTTYWGLRPIPVPGVPVGTSYVGDFNQAVTWFDRGTTDIFITDSHSTNFTANIFVILAEARAAFAVTELAALIEVGITQPGGGGVTAAAKK